MHKYYWSSTRVTATLFSVAVRSSKPVAWLEDHQQTGRRGQKVGWISGPGSVGCSALRGTLVEDQGTTELVVNKK